MEPLRAFWIANLASIGLPTVLKGEARDAIEFERTNGTHDVLFSKLRIKCKHGIPSGKLLRSLLMHLITECKTTGYREIELSANPARLLDILGYTSGGCNYEALETQARRLFSCTFELSMMGQKNCERVADGYQLFSMQRQGGRAYCKLSQRFFNMIQEHAYPVSREIVDSLKSRLLDLDLYLYIAWRMQHLNRTQDPFQINWPQLNRAFRGYKRTADFKRNARESLKRIKQQWPRLRVQPDQHSMKLLPSPLSIPKLKKVDAKKLRRAAVKLRPKADPGLPMPEQTIMSPVLRDLFDGFNLNTSEPP